jgi:hypothetical protein
LGKIAMELTGLRERFGLLEQEKYVTNRKNIIKKGKNDLFIFFASKL